MRDQKLLGVGFFLIGVSVLSMAFAGDYLGWKVPEKGAIAIISVGTLLFFIGGYSVLKHFTRTEG